MAARREPMSSVDTAWLHMDRPTNPMTIVALMRFRRPLDLGRVMQMVEKGFLVFERLKMRPVEGITGVAWEEDAHFRLARHVRRVVLPAPGDERALADLVGRLAGRRLDPRYPRWQFTLIDGVKGGCALLIRIHHCYADGIALIRVLLSLADEAPQHAEPEAAPDKAPGSAVQSWLERVTPAALGRVMHESASLVDRGLHPGEMTDAARQGIGIAAELARVALLADDPPTPLRGKLSTRKRVAWSKPLPLTIAREAAHALGCTINDVLTAAVAGAFGSYLRASGTDVTGLCIRAAVPVNLRSPQEPATLGNQFGLVFAPLPLGIANPYERIFAVHTQMQELRQSQQPLMSIMLLAVLGLAPKTLQQPAIDLLSNKASLVMSNVPGPRTALRICGEELVDVLFWVPQSGNIGVGVSVLTYNGRIHFGVIADRKLIPEPQRVVNAFAKQIRDLAGPVPRLAGARPKR
jgi:WS/DGAT/MGAT family acyltransferase